MGVIIPMERLRKRMEKKEYIEREAVMQKFADHVRRSNNSDFAPVPTWNQAVQIVEDFPAADVRPVVLCKDCKNWDTDWVPKYAKENEYFCPIVTLTTRDDWFCADGEKREET